MRVLLAVAIISMAGVVHSAEPIEPSRIVYYSPNRAVIVNKDYTSVVVVVKESCAKKLLHEGVHRIGCGTKNFVNGVGEVSVGIIVGAGEIVVGGGELVIDTVRDVSCGASRLIKKIVCYDPCKKLRRKCK
jgi:hypothetical protein